MAETLQNVIQKTIYSHLLMLAQNQQYYEAIFLTTYCSP
jgi:hypothetical protein